MQNSTGFLQFSEKLLKIQKHYIPHLKALISSSLEPEGQVIPYDSQNPLIETQTFFTQRGVADLFGGPRPLSLGLQKAAY